MSRELDERGQLGKGGSYLLGKSEVGWAAPASALAMVSMLGWRLGWRLRRRPFHCPLTDACQSATVRRA